MSRCFGVVRGLIQPLGIEAPEARRFALALHHEHADEVAGMLDIKRLLQQLAPTTNLKGSTGTRSKGRIEEVTVIQGAVRP